MTSQFLLKEHKILNFLFAFFLKISETLKAHISGTETDINKRYKAFFSVFNGFSYQPIKKLSKIGINTLHFKENADLLFLLLS